VIRLHKGPAPDILVQKADDWTREYIEAINDNSRMTREVRFRYRHRDIKAALRRDSQNKCIYCEGLIGFGESDHIDPVSARPELVVAWNNLGLVCKECNTHKSNYYVPAEPLINPYVDEPSNHLIFLGATVVPMPGDGTGLRTYLLLKLNRIDLIQRRNLRIDRLTPLVEQWKSFPDPATKDLLQQAVLDEGADGKEYAATIRGYLYHVLGWIWPSGHRQGDVAS